MCHVGTWQVRSKNKFMVAIRKWRRGFCLCRHSAKRSRVGTKHKHRDDGASPRCPWWTLWSPSIRGNEGHHGRGAPCCRYGRFGPGRDRPTRVPAPGLAQGTRGGDREPAGQHGFAPDTEQRPTRTPGATASTAWACGDHTDTHGTRTTRASLVRPARAQTLRCHPTRTKMRPCRPAPHAWAPRAARTHLPAARQRERLEQAAPPTGPHEWARSAPPLLRQLVRRGGRGPPDLSPAHDRRQPANEGGARSPRGRRPLFVEGAGANGSAAGGRAGQWARGGRGGAARPGMPRPGHVRAAPPPRGSARGSPRFPPFSPLLTRCLRSRSFPRRAGAVGGPSAHREGGGGGLSRGCTQTPAPVGSAGGCSARRERRAPPLHPRWAHADRDRRGAARGAAGSRESRCRK